MVLDDRPIRRKWFFAGNKLVKNTPQCPNIDFNVPKLKVPERDTPVCPLQVLFQQTCSSALT
jgi:hypothetical protein